MSNEKYLGVITSSKNDEWTTPREIFDELNEEFNFDLDACASDENHLCENYYTINDDGLLQDWSKKRVFCNPPYSKISDWVEKAYRSTREDKTVVVMLNPSRTDTKYFHDYIYHRSEIRFVKGRLKFGRAENNAPFASMVVIFRGARI